MATKRVDPMADVAGRVLQENPDIKAEMKSLIMAMIRDAKHIMRNGSPAERQKLFGTVVPALLRSMSSADANASESAEKAAFDRMMGMLRGDTPEGSDEVPSV